MTPEETGKLATAFEASPFKRYGPWTFDFEYPGYFVYYHDSGNFNVYFTPDWSNPDEVDIQIQAGNGEFIEGADVPFSSDNPEDLFKIIKPWLDWMAGEGEYPGEETGPLAWNPKVKS